MFCNPDAFLRTARRRGFTLVEVILAIGIATGLLVVALVFYSQATHLRAQLVSEAERLSAVRLVMDRMVTDLHAAFEQPQIGFTGSMDSMEFVVARAPDPAGTAAAAVRWAPMGDLRKVSYYLTASLQGTNFVVTGLDRTEEPLVTKLAAPAAGGGAAGAGPVTASSVAPMPSVVATAGTNAVPVVTEPLADAIRHARFRYWDGTLWLEAWDAPGLPVAVEISLGLEPLPENELAADYPHEVFRRVVILPGRAPVDDFWSSL